MRILVLFTLLAAAFIAKNEYRCPCEESRKPGKDKKMIACNGDESCGCGCSGLTSVYEYPSV